MTLALSPHILFVFLLMLYWKNIQAFHFGEDMLLTLYSWHQSVVLWVYLGYSMPKLGLLQFLSLLGGMHSHVLVPN